MEDNKKDKALLLSKKIFKLARDRVIISLRFFDVALSRIVPRDDFTARLPFFDGQSVHYNPIRFIENVQKENNYAVRLYLHIMLHFIFDHPYFYNRIARSGEDEKTISRKLEYFSLAADIAVSSAILDMGIDSLSLADDDRRADKIRILRKNGSKITAQGIYRYFLANELSVQGEQELKALFTVDDHFLWRKDEIELSLAEWQKLSERIKADIKTFSKDKNKSEALSENLEEATKDKYNYSDILKKFTVMGEDMTVNDDEFDYIFYTYGLNLYKDMPLVEPLEYKDVKKIKDFVIVIDTSASCQGKTIRSFLRKTYSILQSRENYFNKMNIHLIQCDNEVHSDTKITCEKDFEDFIANGQLTGFGGTDYRPAFYHVQSLIENGEFDNLKGLIYFTDGYGIYPDFMPEYETMFVFLDEDKVRSAPPSWAIKVVISEEDIIDDNKAG